MVDEFSNTLAETFLGFMTAREVRRNTHIDHAAMESNRNRDIRPQCTYSHVYTYVCNEKVLWVMLKLSNFFQETIIFFRPGVTSGVVEQLQSNLAPL